jgi:hypothetical protein
MSLTPDARKAAVTTGPRARPQAPFAADSRPPWKTFLVLGLAILLALGGAVFAWYQLRPDPEVEHAKELQKRLFEEGKDMDKEERDKLRKEFRDTVEGFSYQQKQAFTKEWREKMRERNREFLRMTPEEREAALDKQIDDMQARWQNRAARGGGNPGGRQGFGGRGGPGGPPGGGPGGPPGGGGRNRGEQDGPEAVAREQASLDDDSAEDRATAGARGYLMRQQMEKRGVQFGGGFRGPPGGGPPPR